jgi:hypothetical protein
LISYESINAADASKNSKAANGSRKTFSWLFFEHKALKKIDLLFRRINAAGRLAQVTPNFLLRLTIGCVLQSISM